MPNGSPYWRDKDDVRLNIAVARVTESDLPLDLRQPGRRPGRAGVRRRLVRAACRPLARLPAAGVPRAGDDACAGSAAGNGWRCLDGPIAKLAGDADEDDYCACMLGLRDYVDKNGFKGVVLGLSGGIDSALVAALAVDALGRRARALRDAALSLHLAGIARRRGRGREGARRALRRGADRERGAGPRSRRSRRVFAGPAARRHRGEPAGARARHHPDGDLQQVRPDGGDDRQQVGNVGRLRHALRRHERRLQSDQGPLQDRGLSAGAPAQRAGSREDALGPSGRGDPREHHHARADRGAAREPDRPGYAAALRRARRASSNGWSSARSRSPRSSRPASTARP